MENQSNSKTSRYKDIDIIDPVHHVYLAKDLNTGEYCVKKIMDIYNIDVYKYLNHHIIKGVPRVYDYLEEDGQLTVIEELITGSQLSDMIEKKEVSASFVPYIMTQLCEILEKLHSAEPPVVHRDIKPSNIIIDAHGNVHLIDFNASKFYRDRDSSDTMLLGTMGYVAPEQFGFQSSSPQTDIFAMGKVLEELSEAAPGCCDFSPLIKKCTAMDPDERYENVSELRYAIAETAGIPGYENRHPAHHGLKWMLLQVPGFRSGKLWKAAIAVIFYMTLVSVAIETDTSSLPGAWPIIAKVYEFFVIYFMVYCGFNYRDLRFSRPFTKHHSPLITTIGICLMEVVIVFISVVVAAIVDIYFIE